MDVLLILFATALALITGMMDIAIEALCDFLEARHNQKMRVIEDVAAAPVGIGSAVWAAIVIVGVVRLWPRLFG